MDGTIVEASERNERDNLYLPQLRKVACGGCRRAKKTCMQVEDGQNCQRCVRLGRDCERAGTPTTPSVPSYSIYDPLSDKASPRDSAGSTGSASPQEVSPSPPSRATSGSISRHSRSPSLPLFHPIAALPPLPGPKVLDLLLNTYLTKMYDAFPLTIRPLLVQEVGHIRHMPSFFSIAIMLWSARWDPELPHVIGYEQRTLTLELLYSRLQAELLPAIETVLAGYDQNGSIAEYGSLAVWILQSFAHLLDGLVSVPSTDSNVLDNFQNVVRLAMKVARASRLADEQLYGQPVSYGKQNHIPHYSALLERGRRAWWAIVIIDSSFAAMHRTDPVIPWQEFTGIKMGATDVVYQALSGETDGGEVATIDTSNFWFTGQLIRPGTELFPEGSAVAFEPPLERWSIGPVADAPGSRPISATSTLADGAFSPQASAVRIAQINAEISAFRRLRSLPWHPDPTHSYLFDHLASWYAEIPHTYKAVQTMLADVTTPRPIPTGLGALVLMNLMYLCGMISLFAPAEDAFWRGECDREWIQSEACGQARMLADRVTDLIAPLVLEEASVPQMGLPVSSCLRWLRAAIVRRDSH